jgi:hypothetical protein
MNSGIWSLQKIIQGSLAEFSNLKDTTTGLHVSCNGSEEDVRDNFDRSSFN